MARQDLDIHLYEQIVDSHMHSYSMLQKNLPVASILAECLANGMSYALDMGSSELFFKERLQIVENIPQISMALGIHPHELEGNITARLELLKDLARHPKVKAIGEIGLDYFNLERQLESSSARDIEALKLAQKSYFTAQIELGIELDLPLVIHNRDADRDLEHILCTYELPRAGLIHCFSGDLGLLANLVVRGFYFSFAGNLTFKNASSLREAAKQVPVERLLLETDAPYLSPMPRRGQINHPGNIGYTLEVLADCHALPAASLAKIIKKNYEKLFLHN